MSLRSIAFAALCALLPFTLQGNGEPAPFSNDSELVVYTMTKYRDEVARPKPKDEFQLNKILELEQKLLTRIHGQRRPIEITVQSLIRYAAGLGDPDSPIATLLYIGPTGVGKTELAKQLAQELTGSKTNLIRIDLSEYSESHSVSKLIGTPPGYVGFDRGGQLTQALKQHPNAIVLLDEIEKAHPNVLQVFLQAFDDARITDAYGESIDCRRCLFILTTNLASSAILQMQRNNLSYDEILKQIQPILMQQLSPELFNRVEPVLFSPLDNVTFAKIVQTQLQAVSTRLLEKRRIQLSFDPTLVEYLCERGYQYELGARPLKRLIDKEVVTPISYALVQEAYNSGESLRVIYKSGSVVLKKETPTKH
jgi:ATP-dependent Clp protease ATP-binding subunit ClpA